MLTDVQHPAPCRIPTMALNNPYSINLDRYASARVFEVLACDMYKLRGVG